MHILVYSWRDPKHPLAGGAEQVMHEHMKGWANNGNKVTLFSSKIKDRPNFEQIDGINIVRSGYEYLGVQIAGFFYYLKNRKTIDFVVDQFHGIPFFTPLYVRKNKLAVLQEVAKEVWFKNPFMFPINILVGIVGYLIEPVVFLFYMNCKFMVGSSSAMSDLLKLGVVKENISIVPHGLIVPKSLPKHKFTKTKVITYFGPLTKDKGIIDALRVFAILNKDSEFKFVVIGRPDSKFYYKKVMNMVFDLGLSSKIKFYNRPSDYEKFKILSKSFVLVNPSVREGWGLVNIEANAVGTPVIAYPSQGLVDSVVHGVSGILTSEKSPDKIAKAILLLKQDDVKYKKLSVGAKMWSKKFNWNNSVKLSLNLIDNICE